jgi:hypothetical protein
MSWRASGVAFAVYSMLAVALTFPLVLHLPTVVPHDLGDPLVSASILWWNAHVVPLTARWWDGFAFFPSTGVLAFSDHRLGESLIASPLQWLGSSPMTAYNVTLILTFPLCALAGHWLGYTLTKRHDAAAIAGLVYGFNPYRISHIEHLELLAAFGMPATLAALHHFVSTRRWHWLVIFAAALIVTGLCTSYYLLFFGILLALWLVWFLHGAGWRTPAAIVAAAGCGMAALLPLAIGYVRIHREYGFARSINDIVTLSADVTSFVTASPLVALWGWTSSLNGPERQLFPGLTVAALVTAAAVVAIRRAPGRRGQSGARVPLAFLGIALVFAGVAAAAAAFGPGRLAVGPFALTIGVPFKPLSLGLIAAAVALLATAPVRDAFHRRSPFAFYVLATGVLLVCALGPKPRFLGYQFWYEPPYAWLMRFPLFSDGVRVPARFAMPALATLSAAGALAFVRLGLGDSRRRWAAAAVMAAVLAEGWMHDLPLYPVPQAWTRADIGRFAAAVELPITEDLFAETAAMMRATSHERPVLNGNSGYYPPEYWVLRGAALEHDWSVLRAYTSTGPLLIAIERARDPDGRVASEIRALSDARYLDTDGRWTFFELGSSARPAACAGTTLPLAGARDSAGPIDLNLLTDRDPMTRWLTSDGQHEGDTIELELGRLAQPCDIRLSLGAITHVYPRSLRVATSIDGVEWQAVFEGSTAAQTVRGAIADPRDVWLDVIPTRELPARFVRLRLGPSTSKLPWVVAAVVVKGVPVPDER